MSVGKDYRTNGSTLRNCDGWIIIGHMNTVYGNDITVHGSENIIYGERITLHGIKNKVYGSIARDHGTGNICYSNELEPPAAKKRKIDLGQLNVTQQIDKEMKRKYNIINFIRKEGMKLSWPSIYVESNLIDGKIICITNNIKFIVKNNGLIYAGNDVIGYIFSNNETETIIKVSSSVPVSIPLKLKIHIDCQIETDKALYEFTIDEI